MKAHVHLDCQTSCPPWAAQGSTSYREAVRPGEGSESYHEETQVPGSLSSPSSSLAQGSAPFPALEVPRRPIGTPVLRIPGPEVQSYVQGQHQPRVERA